MILIFKELRKMNKYSLTFTLQDEKIIFNLSGKIDSMNVSDLQSIL